MRLSLPSSACLVATSTSRFEATRSASLPGSSTLAASSWRSSERRGLSATSAVKPSRTLRTSAVTSTEPGLLEVVGPNAEAVGELAAAARLVLHELTPVTGSLEEAYMNLTAGEVEYHSGVPTDGAHTAAPATAAVPAIIEESAR